MDSLFIGHHHQLFDQLDSTNDTLKKASTEENLPEGYSVQAYYQQKGKGQRGNSWESESNLNLTLSVLLYPRFVLATEAFMMGKLVACALHEMLNLFDLPNVKIKWPNDIFVGDKKIAGILIENSIKGNTLSDSIIGVGLNVNQKDFHTPNCTSISTFSHKRHRLNKVKELYFETLERWYSIAKINPKKVNEYYFKHLLGREQYLTYDILELQKRENLIISNVEPSGQIVMKDSSDKEYKFWFKEIKLIK